MTNGISADGGTASLVVITSFSSLSIVAMSTAILIALGDLVAIVATGFLAVFNTRIDIQFLLEPMPKSIPKSVSNGYPNRCSIDGGLDGRLLPESIP